uniref:Pectinesterase inhibitor domain-containing protein n=1 Tax=Aegilops tauschii TaxID=37682 RepID=M8BD05_AEGTA
MATTIYVLALSLTTTTLPFTCSRACPRDPLMTIAAACPQNPSLPKELRAAYDHCIGKYDMVKNKIGAIDNAVRTCWFATFKQDCVDVAAAIDDCAHNLQPVGSSSPLYKMVLADRDLSALSCSLALLGVAKKWH